MYLFVARKPLLEICLMTPLQELQQQIKKLDEKGIMITNKGFLTLIETFIDKEQLQNKRTK